MRRKLQRVECWLLEASQTGEGEPLHVCNRDSKEREGVMCRREVKCVPLQRGRRIAQGKARRSAQNSTEEVQKIIFFSKLFGGECPWTPYLNLPPSSQLAPTPLHSILPQVCWLHSMLLLAFRQTRRFGMHLDPWSQLLLEHGLNRLQSPTLYWSWLYPKHLKERERVSTHFESEHSYWKWN